MWETVLTSTHRSSYNLLAQSSRTGTYLDSSASSLLVRFASSKLIYRDFSSHTMDSLFQPNRKRGSKYQLKFFKEPTIKKNSNHNYIKYSSTSSAGVSIAHSSIQTKIIAESEDNAISVDAEPDENNDWIDAPGDEAPPSLEQAHHDINHHDISDEPENIMIDEGLKRERPKGVSSKRSARYDIEKANLGLHRDRTRPYDNGNNIVINFWKSLWYLKGGGNGHQRCV